MTDNRVEKYTDYTQGSIIGSILKMGLPSMFGFLVQHVYTMVDTYWVSRLPGNESGVAAITFFGNILWFFFAFNQLVGPGSVAIISRRYGEKAFDAAEKAIKETLALKMIFGSIIGVFGYFFAGTMLYLVGARDEVLEMGIQYGGVMFLGLPLAFTMYSIFTAMRGIANPAMAMVLMISSNILNLILDPVFIFGWGGLPAMGIVGAAYASVLSFVITLFVGIVLFYGGFTSIRLHLKGKQAISLWSMWKMVKIGIPAWLGQLSFSGSRLIITPLVASYGTAVIAAYGIGTQVFSFGIMLLVGIGLGLSSLIGHNLGGKKYERAKKTADQSILLGVGIMSVLGLIAYIYASSIMGIFFKHPETIAIGTELLQIMAVGFPFFGAFIMLEEIHMGVGLNTPSMVVSILHSWGFQVIPILIFTRFFECDVTTVWWVLALSGVLSSTLFYFYYRRGRWLQVQV